jgi:TonB dependent receptor/CarboxypepD_reg-like domain/TonB-dependent Receptor Plug Domain
MPPILRIKKYLVKILSEKFRAMIKRLLLGGGLLLLLQLTADVFANHKARVKLEGTVLDSRTNLPIVGASVFERDSQKGTKTDANGHFEMTLPFGRAILQVTAVGYFPKSLFYNLGDDLNVTILLDERIENLDGVEVKGRKADANVKDVQMSQIQLNVANLKKIPVVFGEVDLIKALVLQPGITTVGEGAGGFNVRGGRVDQNLVLLDGAPVFNTSHLLGFFASINPDAVQEASLFKGGIPAQYGGRLSSLFLLNTKNGNEETIRFSAGLGTISARMVAEGPLTKDKKLTFMLGGRYAYPNLLIDAFPDRFQGSRANFHDINAKLQYKLNTNNALSMSLYRSYDNFKFPEDTLYGWTSNIASFKWNSLINKKLSLQLNVLHSDYTFWVDGLLPEYEYRTQNSIKHQEARLGFFWTPDQAEKHKIDFGGNFIRYGIDPGERRPTSANSNVNPLKIDTEQAQEMALYISDEWALTKNISLQIGLRASFFNHLGPAQVARFAEGQARTVLSVQDTLRFGAGETVASYSGLEPRVALRFQLAENTSIKANFNRTRQYLHLISNTTAISPVDFWKTSNRYVPPQQADQFALGFFQNFSDNMYQVDVEGYYKDIRDMVEYRDGANLLLNPLLEADLLNARGRAYGIELSLRKRKGRLTYDLSYTYSRSFVQVNSPYLIDQVNRGNWFPSLFDKPHVGNFSGQYALAQGWTFSLNYTYQTGRPATFADGLYVLNGTPVNNFSSRNLDRIPDYHRMDVSFVKDTRKNKDQKKYSTWVFSIYNLYGRRNPYSIYPITNNFRTNYYQLSVFGTMIPSLSWNRYF